MWRRLAIAAALATAAVAAFSLLYVRSDAGGRHLCAVVSAALQEASHQPVTIGRCEVRPFGPRVTIEHVVIGDPERPLLAAERLSAGIRPRALLDERVRLEGVELVRPRVHLDLPAAKDDAETASLTGRCLPDLGPLEIGSVRVVDGEVSLTRPGSLALRATGLMLEAGGDGDRLSVELRAATSHVNAAGRDWQIDRAGVRALVDAASGTLVVEALDVSTPEGSVFAQVDIASLCSLDATATASLQLDLGRLGERLPEVPGLSGQVRAQLSASLDRGAWEVTGDVDVDDSKVLNMRPGDVRARLRLVPGTLEIARLEWPMDGGTVQATGALTLEAPWRIQGHASVDRVALGSVLDRVGVDPIIVHVLTTGDVDVDGQLAGERGFRLEGSTRMQVAEFGVYNRAAHDRARATKRWVGTRDTAVRGRFAIEKDHIAINQVRIATGDTDVGVDGVIHFSVRKGMTLEVDAPRVSLVDIGPFGKVDAKGQGSLKGRVTGPYRELDFEARADMQDVEVMRFRLGQVASSARLNLATSKLVVPDARATKGRTQYAARGEVSFEDEVLLDARIDVPTGRARDLLDLFGGRWPSFLKLVGGVDGQLAGHVDAAGLFEEPDLHAVVSLGDVRLWGQAFPTGAADLTIEKLSRVRVDSLRLERGEGWVQADGWYGIDDDSFDANLLTRRMRTHYLDHLAEWLPGVEGGVTLSVRGEGTLDNPRASGRLTLRDWQRGGIALGTTRLQLALDGDQLDVDGTISSSWPEGERPPPRAPGEPSPLPPGSMFHSLRAAVQLSGDMPFSLEADLDAPELSRLLPPGKLGGMEAAIGGALSVRGEAKRWRQSIGALSLDRFWVRHGRTELHNSGPALVGLEQGRLTLHSLPLRGPGFRLDAYGAREQDGRLDVTVLGSAALDILRQFEPGLDDARGQLDVELAITGTDVSPVFVGHAAMRDVALRHRELPVALSAGQARITFSPDTVVLDGLDALMNGAPFEASGEMALESLRPGRFEVRTHLVDVPLGLRDLPLVVSGSPVLSGTLDQMTLSGDVEVTRMRFTRDLELERALVKALDFTRRPPAPRVMERAGEFLTMDLGVRLGDVRVENNLLRADLRGDLRLTGTNRRPGLLGAVMLVDAVANVRNTEYVVSSGVVNFTDPHRIRPAFDVRADAQVREYLVHVTATGTPQSPRLMLSSEPALSEADIVTLVTLGVTTRDFERTGGASIGGVVLDAAYNASGLGSQLREVFGDEGPLKDAQFRVTSAYSELSGNIEPIAQFEGRILEDRAKLRGQTSLLGSRGRRAQVEVNLGGNVSGQIQADGDNPSVSSGFDLGGDLKWQWESP